MQADLKSMTMDELKTFFEALGEPGFRARQVFEWLHVRAAVSFDDMTNLPKTLRETLKEKARLTRLQTAGLQVSKIDGTRKYLFSLEDGNLIEAVLMKYQFGNSVCISTQAGCRMGCAFCASTLGGLARNLTPAEMLEEVYEIERETHERVSHLVLMGSGEPFDNYDAVMRFLRILISPEGRNFSARHITVSTSGLTERILDFSKEGLPVTLALSLHAADQETREGLMPVAKANPLEKLLGACDAYFKETGRRVTYEYAVVKNVNDSLKDADRLARLLKGRGAHVNLIPVNPVTERKLRRPDAAAVSEFQKYLEKCGINATIRRELGADIDGACGQLRARKIREGLEETLD